MIPRHVTPLCLRSMSHDLTFLKDRLSHALILMSDCNIWMHFSAIFLHTSPFMQFYLIRLHDTERRRLVWNATGTFSYYDTYFDFGIDKLVLLFEPSNLLSPSKTNPFNLFLLMSHPSIVIMSDIFWL
jgi:hypothetical protein